MESGRYTYVCTVQDSTIVYKCRTNVRATFDTNFEETRNIGENVRVIVAIINGMFPLRTVC